MSKIRNEESLVNYNKEMNDIDFLKDLIESEKSISEYYNRAMNEVSNKYLFKKISVLFNNSKIEIRRGINTLFNNGWITYKMALENDVSETYEEGKKRLKEL